MADMPADAVRVQLKKWVLAEGLRNGAEAPADDVDLMREGFIDSLGLMGLISYVEELRGKPLGDDEMRMENFTSINRIVKVFFLAPKAGAGAFSGRR